MCDIKTWKVTDLAVVNNQLHQRQDWVTFQRRSQEAGPEPDWPGIISALCSEPQQRTLRHHPVITSPINPVQAQPPHLISQLTHLRGVNIHPIRLQLQTSVQAQCRFTPKGHTIKGHTHTCTYTHSLLDPTLTEQTHHVKSHYFLSAAFLGLFLGLETAMAIPVLASTLASMLWVLSSLLLDQSGSALGLSRGIWCYCWPKWKQSRDHVTPP